MYTLSFAPESISQVARFYGFPVLLAEEVQVAMHLGGELLVRKAQEKTWEVFEHPTGELAGEIEEVQDSPYEVQIVSKAKYSERRERGFSGMTDSLGRYYPNDPGKPFMEPTLEENEQEVMIMIEQGVARALQRLAVGE